MTKPKYILLDGDTASHFITGGFAEALPNIFPFKMKILRSVYDFLARTSTKKAAIQYLVSRNLIQIIDFPDNDELIYNEFLKLSRGLRTEGENAAMAIARHNNNVIGSSNLIDVLNYFKVYSIPYLTTLDFLDYAENNGTLSLDEIDNFHRKNKAAGIRIPSVRNEKIAIFNLEGQTI